MRRLYMYWDIYCKIAMNYSDLGQGTRPDNYW